MTYSSKATVITKAELPSKTDHTLSSWSVSVLLIYLKIRFHSVCYITDSVLNKKTL
jgi:hypothetical protein